MRPEDAALQAPPARPGRGRFVARLLAGLGVITLGVGVGIMLMKPWSRQPATLPATRPAAEKTAGAGDEALVWIPGGSFRRGASGVADAEPVRAIEVDGFWIDRTEVTNAEFARFIAATGYKTVAEQVPDAQQFPGVPPESLRAGSIVFTPPTGVADLNQPLSWWSYVPGTDWRHPSGPGSSIAGMDDHPVVQVCWDDAVAYAQWAGKRLPTEAEWEYAARGGLDQAPFAWGNEFALGNRWQANTWQGRFPTSNARLDGFAATAPVGSFPPNGYGLVDMAGNVWEWCADWYRPDGYESASAHNPTGPTSSFDPDEPGVPKRVQRGGSFLCSDDYCTRYRPGTRGKGEPTSAASHTGFRCVRSAPRQGMGPIEREPSSLP